MNVNVNNLSGLAGGILIGPSAKTDGDFNAIQFLSNGGLSAYEGNVTQLVGTTFLAGTILYGRYKSVTLSAGKAILYTNG
jgi:hypothetical protein